MRSRRGRWHIAGVSVGVGCAGKDDTSNGSGGTSATGGSGGGIGGGAGGSGGSSGGAAGGSGGSSAGGSPSTTFDCADYDPCSVSIPCDGTLHCISVSACGEPICISVDEACEAECGSAPCVIMESYPEQIACGNGGDPVLETCEDVQAAINDELAVIQGCETAAECGQVLTGTSCGCTRNLVARLDADDTHFRELLAVQSDMQCGAMGSTCDCPAEDGYACENGRCTWNYL